MYFNIVIFILFSLALEYTGGVPFEILEPILKQVSCNHLYRLEDFNPYLIEDTGELWEFHCKKEFRNKIPGKNESWRDFYIVSINSFIIKHNFKCCHTYFL